MTPPNSRWLPATQGAAAAAPKGALPTQFPKPGLGGRSSCLPLSLPPTSILWPRAAHFTSKIQLQSTCPPPLPHPGPRCHPSALDQGCYFHPIPSALSPLQTEARERSAAPSLPLPRPSQRLPGPALRTCPPHLPTLEPRPCLAPPPRLRAP